MDIDESAIGVWPNIACAPGEAVAHRPTDTAHETALRIIEANRAPQYWGIAEDLTRLTHFTMDEVRDRIDAAILREVEAMIREGGAE